VNLFGGLAGSDVLRDRADLRERLGQVVAQGRRRSYSAHRLHRRSPSWLDGAHRTPEAVEKVLELVIWCSDDLVGEGQ